MRRFTVPPSSGESVIRGCSQDQATVGEHGGLSPLDSCGLDAPLTADEKLASVE